MVRLNIKKSKILPQDSASLLQAVKAIGALCLCIFVTVRLFDSPEFDKYTSIDTTGLTSSLASIANNDDDYALAKRQSLGFFDDISTAHWKRLQEKVNAMSPNFVEWLMKQKRGQTFWWFWQGHYEPDFVCQHERRLGREAEGGKWICDPHRITNKVKAGGNCLVYSIGSNNEFSFEQSVHRRIHKDCDIHIFDFGDYAEGAKKAGGKLTYHRHGLQGSDHTAKGRVFKSLDTVFKELGHQNTVIDIFKIDCEGCEFSTVKTWFEAAEKHNVIIRQIQVEMHNNPIEDTFAFFDTMYENGYVIFHKEFNLIAVPYKGTAIEYAFLKLDPEFTNAVPRRKGVNVMAKINGSF